MRVLCHISELEVEGEGVKKQLVSFKEYLHSVKCAWTLCFISWQQNLHNTSTWHELT